MKKHVNLYLIMTMIFATLFLVAIMYSSFKKYMINSVLSKSNNYHVKILTDNFNYTDMSCIKSFSNKSSTYYITFNDISQIHKETDKICKKVGCKKVIYNEKLLKTYDMVTDPSFSLMKIFIFMFLILLALFALILKNTFSMIYYKRIKELAIMNSLGMTRCDMTLFFLREFGKVFLFGLFTGFILGVILAYIIHSFIENLLDVNEFYIYFDLLYFIVIILIIILVFLFSMFLPLTKFNDNIIKVINNVDEIKYRKIPFRFGLTTHLAYLNYRRNKKRCRLFTLTVFISITLFVLVNISISYIEDGVKGYVDVLKYDAIIKTDINENGLSILNEYVKMDKRIEKYSLFRTCYMTLDVPVDSYINSKYYNFEKIITLIGNNKDLVINKVPETKRYKKEYKTYLKKFVFANEDVSLTDSIPFGVDTYVSSSNIVMLKKDIEKWCPSYETILIIKGHDLKIKQGLLKLKKKYLDVSFEYTDYAKAKRKLGNILLMVRIIIFVFTGLVMLTGLTFFANSLFSNLERRSQEISILRGLGAEDKVLKSVLLRENIFVLLKSTILSVIVVIIINNYLFEMLLKYFDVKWHNPLFATFICLLALYAVIYFTLCKIYVTNGDV